MRRSTWVWWLMLAVAAALLVPAPTSAQSVEDPDEPPTGALEEEPAAEDDAEAREAEADEDQPASQPRRAGQGDERRESAQELRRRLEQFKALREALYDQIELDEEQDDAVHRLFAEQLERLQEAKHRLSDPDAAREDQDVGREMRRLFELMREARRREDHERVEELRAQIDELRKHGTGDLGQDTARFVGELRAQLSGAQVERFDEITRELGLGGERQAGRTRYRRFIDILVSDELGLSDEQTRTVREIIREQRRAASEGRRGEPDFERMYDVLKERVLEELTDEQAEKLAEAVKADARKIEQRQKSKAKRQVRKEQRGSDGQGLDPEPGAEPEDEDEPEEEEPED